MKKPKVLVDTKVKQLADGDSWRVYYRKNKRAVDVEICCGCSMKHLIEYKPTKRYLKVKAWRA